MQNFPTDILESIRIHLEDDKKNTLARMVELNVQDPFSDPERANDNASSDGDANEESSHDRFAAMVEELNKHVKDIDAALFRISNGTYGYCTKCGNMIDTDRLAILPTATLCLNHGNPGTV